MVRKGIFIIYNISLGGKIEELLNKCEIGEFTIIKGVIGAGKAGGKRFNNEVYPGENDMVFIATDETHFIKFKSTLHALYEEYKSDGITYFSFTMDG